MATGDTKGVLTGNAASVGTSLAISTGGPVTVGIGDLIYAVIVEQTTPTSTACNDNLTNAYTSVQNATTDGAATGHAYYSIVTVAGSLSSVTFTTNGGTNNAAAIAVVVAGKVTAIDNNPTQIADRATPYVGPASGAGADAPQVILDFIATNGAPTYTATAPNVKAGQSATASVAAVAVGTTVRGTTLTYSPGWTATTSSFSGSVLGTTSFKLEPLPTGQQSTDTVDDPAHSFGKSGLYRRALRTWIHTDVNFPAAPVVLSYIPTPFDWQVIRPCPARFDLYEQGNPLPLGAAVVADVPFVPNVWPAPRVNVRLRLDLLEQGTPVPLTIAAPVVITLPFNQYDWPIAGRSYPTSLRTWIKTDPNVPAPPAALSYQLTPFDWQPVPGGPKPYPVQLRTWIKTDVNAPPPVVVVPLPYNQYSWPLAPGARRQADLRTWTCNALALWIEHEVWREPLEGRQQRPYPYPVSLRTWIQTNVNAPPPPPLTFPVVTEHQWPLQAGAREPYQNDLRTWVKTDPNAPAPPVIVYQLTPFDWQAPLTGPKSYPVQLRTWINTTVNAPPFVAPAIPVGQASWALPATARHSNDLRTWVKTDVNAPAPVVVAAPFTQSNQSLPIRRFYPNDLRSWVKYDINAPQPVVEVPPRTQKDWPLQAGANKPYPNSLRTWTKGDVNAPPFVPEIPAIRNYDWPLQAGAIRPYPFDLRTWLRGDVNAPPAPTPPPEPESSPGTGGGGLPGRGECWRRWRKRWRQELEKAEQLALERAAEEGGVAREQLIAAVVAAEQVECEPERDEYERLKSLIRGAARASQTGEVIRIATLAQMYAQKIRRELDDEDDDEEMLLLSL